MLTKIKLPMLFRVIFLILPFLGNAFATPACEQFEIQIYQHTQTAQGMHDLITYLLNQKELANMCLASSIPSDHQYCFILQAIYQYVAQPLSDDTYDLSQSDLLHHFATLLQTAHCSVPTLPDSPKQPSSDSQDS